MTNVGYLYGLFIDERSRRKRVSAPVRRRVVDPDFLMRLVERLRLSALDTGE